MASNANTRSKKKGIRRESATAFTAIALTALAALFAAVAPGSLLAQEVEIPASTAEWLNPDRSARKLDLTGIGGSPLEIGPERAPIVFKARPTLAQRTETTGIVGPTGQPTRSPVGWGEQKSYGIPALEILGFQTLLNLFDRAYFGCCDFDTDLNSIGNNLHRGWRTDADSFTVNQLGHPYQGSMYFGLARSTGLNFWEGFLYAFAGSAVWEIAGETTPPSKNDQITTPIGGTFLGEALFRMANLWLEKAPVSPFWREVGAAVVSPPVGFNRLAFGNRFKGIYPSNNPEYYSRLAVGVSSATTDEPGPAKEVKRTEGVVDFALDYGLPGKRDYVYRRPFDYFSFQATASTGVGFESVLTRGLLFGTDYGKDTDRYRGIWGLYGSYDYISPSVFRLASSALSLGTTLEWRASQNVTFQGSLLGGLGYATVSTVRGIPDERANHYGMAPQAALVFRTIFSERASLDLSAREYFVSDVSGGDRGGHDNIVRGDATFTWRVAGQHAIAVKYQFSRRDAEFPDIGDRTQKRGTIGIFYTLLGRDRFGTGEWK
jgi:hypothetical protein